MSKFKVSTKGREKAPVPPGAGVKSVDKFIQGAALADAVTQGRGVKPMRLNLEIDVEIHRKLKIRAAERGVSISKLVRDLIDKELES
ncbi:plasmid partition protein ParG [Thiobacillus denitrificans]|uniref:plasmid partition protein ParG n=1 Tax=Thiobacillus denitrificans TaxID=36861 RepID=UPI00036F2FC4|nr:plasmid partition protein ParG [Thiobacillus denitrificans]